MRTTLPWTAVAVATAAVIIILGLAFAGLDQAQAKTFVLAVLATFAGILAGVPTALAIADHDRAAARLAAAKDRRKRRWALLDQVEQDLTDTLGELTGTSRQPRCRSY